MQIKEQYPSRYGEKCRTEVRGCAVREFENVQQEAELIAEMIPEPRKNWVIIDATTLNAEAGRMLAQMGISDSTIEPGVTIEDVVGFLKNALPAAKEGGVISFV